MNLGSDLEGILCVVEKKLHIYSIFSIGSFSEFTRSIRACDGALERYFALVSGAAKFLVF